MGDVVVDYAARFPAAMAEMAEWVRDGKIVYEKDVQQGFENVPRTLLRLYSGENFGKQLLAV